MSKRRIVLLGATGYTGQRVLQQLLARGEEPVLIGRSRTRMQATANRLRADLAIIEVDVTSADALSRIFTSNDVVVSTVGPFMQLGMATIEAAARAGAHYLDSTGEGNFVRYAFGLHDIATDRGATIVPAFGYDYVPGNLAGALALTRAGTEATQVEIGYFLTRAGHGDELQYRSTLRDSFNLTSGGTRQTLVGAAAENSFSYRRAPGATEGHLVDERVAKRVRTFTYAGVSRAGMTVPGSEQLGLPEAFPQLEHVDVYMGWFGRWTRSMQAATAVQAPLLRSKTVRNTLVRLSENLPFAEREPDRDGRTLVVAVASDRDGRELTTTALTGPDPYQMTASLLAWGAARAAKPGAALAPGVHGPVVAFGLDALTIGAAMAGLDEAVLAERTVSRPVAMSATRKKP